MKARSVASDEAIGAARRELAAALRLAALENLHEGIDNHFSYDVGDGTFLINRHGVHWTRMTPEDVLRVDHDGNVIEGSGKVEATAFQIHSAIHRRHSGATAILHTHQCYATALACCEGESLKPISQAALMFYDDVAYERDYRGLAQSAAEGERLAAAMGGKSVLFLANHGVIVVGETIGIAFHDLYFLERAAKLQMLAAGSGSPMATIPADVAARTHKEFREQKAEKEAFFYAMTGILETTEPQSSP